MVGAIAPLFDEIVAARPRARGGLARRALAQERPWEEWRTVFARALASDPARAAPGFSALAAEAYRREDFVATGRILAFEGHAAHRAGRMDEAVRLYQRAERLLSRSGLPREAFSAAVARIDAWATAGRPRAALALAGALSRSAGRSPAGLAALAVQRGNVLRLEGRTDEARRAFAKGARAFDRLADPRRAAIARLNAGVAAVEAGDARAGRAAISSAGTALSDLGHADLAREAAANAAWADVHAGELGRGIRALEALSETHRLSGLHRREGICRMDLADALRRAGDPDAAEREAVAAAACFERARAPGERAEALWVAAASAAGQAAARHARDARAAAAASGRRSLVLRAELLALDVRARSGGRRVPSPASAAALAEAARRLGHRALEAEARVLQGTLALARGDAAGARRAFSAARQRARGRPWTRIEAQAGLACVDARAPRAFARALGRLRRLARFQEQVLAGLPGAWLRSRFSAERLDPWLARVDLLLRRGRPSDRRQAEALLDALAARRLLRARPPAIGARAARIRARLEALYDRIARGDGPTRGGDDASGGVLEARARAWERAFVAEQRRVERRHETGADSSDSLSPDAPEADDPGVARVHVWHRDGRVVGLVRIGSRVDPPVDLGPLARLPAWAAALRLHGHAFAHLGPAASAAAPAAQSLLDEIGREWLLPLGAERWPALVHVTADPALPDLPWELLPVRGEPLGLRRAVLRVPLGRARPRRPRAGRGASVIGVGASDVPGVEREVMAVAALLGADETRPGGAATRDALARALREARVVHVAGHGWDAEEAPTLGGVRMADGWFCAEDVPDVVAADLVVLAACRSGRAAGRAASAWGGLVSRLLAAGAGCVVWADDDVDDRATSTLMSTYHSERRAAGDPTSFARALVRTAADLGHPGAVLAFRISGVRP